MLLLTGPTASGKNSVAKSLALRRERCAVVDFDLVRAMFVQPHQPPWTGKEGKAQQILGVRQICNLAMNFKHAEWEVIILDVLSNETVKLYRSLLKGADHKVVQLLPAFDELKNRFYQRGACLTEDELKMVYKEQSRYLDYDLRIDNTDLPPEEVAEMIAILL